MTINDIKKHIHEWDQKFSDLSSEVFRAREDVVSTSAPTKPVEPSPRRLRSNAPAKSPRILPIVEFERKRKFECKSDVVPSKFSRTASDQMQQSISNKISESITKNISSKILKSMAKKTAAQSRIRGRFINPLASSRIDVLLKTPLSCIRTRKRKMIDSDNHMICQ